MTPGWNLPPGAGMTSEADVEHKCPTCGERWTCFMFFELGGWFYNPKDEDREGGAICPNGCEEDPILDPDE